MAKVQSFADKANKKIHTVQCPVCGADIQYIKLCRPSPGKNGSVKIKNHNVGVCKCNESEIYG